MLTFFLTWIIAAVIAMLPAMGYGEVVFYRSLLTCFVAASFSSSYYVLITLLSVISPLVALVTFNSLGVQYRAKEHQDRVQH